MEGGFRAWEDVGWVIRGLRWNFGGFPTLDLQKKAYMKNYRRTHENYRRKTGKLQEAYRGRPRAIFTILRV